MTFIDWIEQFGTRRLANVLGVSTGTVNAWKHGKNGKRCIPRPEIAERIVELSTMRLTIDDVRPTTRKTENG